MFKHDLRNDGGRSVERFAQNARLVIIDVLICLRMRDPARDVVFDLVELLQRVDGLVGGFWELESYFWQGTLESAPELLLLRDDIPQTKQRGKSPGCWLLLRFYALERRFCARQQPQARKH